MTSAEFGLEIERLKKTYGNTSYPPHCIEALWEELGHITALRFRKVINRVLANNPNSKYPPGISEIEKQLAHFREDAIATEKIHQKNYADEAAKVVKEKFLDANQVSEKLRFYTEGL